MSNLFKSKKLRTWAMSAAMVLALFLAGRIFLSGKANAAATSSEEKVTSVNVTEAVDASGSLDALLSANLTWSTSGVVDQIYVKAGDQVKAGDLLMKLKTSSVSSNVISAHADLANVQKALADLLSSSGTDSAQASIDLKDAQEAYDKAASYLTIVNVTETVDASGSLEAQPLAGLTWKISGFVEEVSVKAGDQVKAGDVLMRLKTSSVSSSVISAQADLANAQKDLDDLLSSSSTDLAQATMDLRDAQQAYDRAVNYLEFLQRAQQGIPQTQAIWYLETINRGGKGYVFKTKEFKMPANADWITEAENDLALKRRSWKTRSILMTTSKMERTLKM
jgi:multidrug efflux pump subunit AcrA (membrane-fusion protein)